MLRDLADQRDVFLFILMLFLTLIQHARRRFRQLVPPKFLSQRELFPVPSSRPLPINVYWQATSVFHFSLAIALG